MCRISGSSTLDDPPFKLYKNSTSVSNSYSDQVNVNFNHNYKGKEYSKIMIAKFSLYLVSIVKSRNPLNNIQFN